MVHDDPPEGIDSDTWNALPQEIKDELRPAPSSSTKKRGDVIQSFLSFGSNSEENRLDKDDQFPPSFKSIDGRNVGHNSSDVRVPKCGCNRDMKLSRVSRSGKNQGICKYSIFAGFSRTNPP